MSLYAKVKDGKVTKVIIAEADIINNIVETEPGFFVETFSDADGTESKRYNLAGVGHSYDSSADAFYSPKPHNSWVLNTDNYKWEAPVEQPEGQSWWDEENTEWVEGCCAY
jgi:hypothetical protein